MTDSPWSAWRLRISLPLYTIVPLLVGFAAVWGLFQVLDAVRFTTCTPWFELPAPPEPISALQGAFDDRLYAASGDRATVCLADNHWSACALPPYGVPSAQAPAWLIDLFPGGFFQPGVSAAVRSGAPANLTYHYLLADHRIFTCATDLDAELDGILKSGAWLWLLPPALAAAWSVYTFTRIFVQTGQPTWWDFWGKGRRIK